MSLDRWILAHARRLVRILLILQIAGFAFFVAGTHGAFVALPDPPTTTDFASFYAAGRLANAGRPEAAYDPAAHRTAEEAAIAPGVEEKRFLNPPPFLLVCAPLARLPYLPAFLLFELTTATLWLALTTRIAGGGTFATSCLAAIPAVWWALGWGQNSFLSGSLMAAGTLLLSRRPWLAGAAFGALCFKPHFGLLIPMALLAGRHWRAIGGAALSAVGLCALSALCFGAATWRAFIAMALHARQTVETGIQLAGHVDAGGAARLAGLAANASWVLQACITLVAAACVVWAFAKTRRQTGAPADAACAVLVSATLAAMPFVLFYDLVMAGLAAAWLTRAALRTGWRPGEPTCLAACLLLSLVAFALAATLHLAVGVLVSPLLLGCAVARLAGHHPGD